MNEPSVFFPTLLLVSGVGLALYSSDLIAKEFPLNGNLVEKIAPSSEPIERPTIVSKTTKKTGVELIARKQTIPSPSLPKKNLKKNIEEKKITAEDQEKETPTAPKASPECAPKLTIFFKKRVQFSESFEVKSKSLLDWLKKHPQQNVLVKGHADGQGSEVYNLKLSHRRAKKVADELKKRGLSQKRITVQAFGEYQPEVNLEKKRQRRVVIKIIGEQPCKENE